MRATLAQLHRETDKVVHPVIHDGQKVILTDEGEACAEIIPIPKVDRKAALAILRSIGPVELPPRK